MDDIHEMLKFFNHLKPLENGWHIGRLFLGHMGPSLLKTGKKGCLINQKRTKICKI